MHCFFACKNVTQNVRVFEYYCVTQSASFFSYKMYCKVHCFKYISVPPPPSISKFNKSHITQSVRIFVQKNVTQIVLLFSKCLAFCI